MAKNRFTIKDKELAQALEISPERLYEVIKFFDSDPDDEWELKEHDHYVYTSQKWGNRIFSAQGAYAIAKYLDTHEKKSLWDKIKEFVTHHKEKIRNAFVQRTVHENSSSLVLHNSRYFLSKRDTIAILGTSYARLNKSFEVLRRSDKPLEIYKDFDEIEGARYYSLSGFYRLSQDLSQHLTSKDRREWCKAVDVVGQSTFKAIVSAKESRQKRIRSAMKAARKRDNDTCQVTGEKPTRHHQFDMASHHIFSSHHYPHLAATVENLITLKGDVHKEFHSWNGGNSNPCTVEDLTQFVCERYPDNANAMTRLYEVKGLFSHELPLNDVRRASDQRLISGGEAA